MKQKIYIETSVISYLVARPSKSIVVAGHQASTIDMWETLDNYEPYISDIVIQEASKGDQPLADRRLKVLEDFQVLRIDDEAKVLARLFLTGKAIPQNCPEDALHIRDAEQHRTPL
ncbi:MAG: hypothetical protein ACE5H1_10950 [Thermodesulfobacteriota bacterium]